jgi:hypothetical protein
VEDAYLIARIFAQTRWGSKITGDTLRVARGAQGDRAERLEGIVALRIEQRAIREDCFGGYDRPNRLQTVLALLQLVSFL